MSGGRLLKATCQRLLLRPLEISQIGRRLVLAGGHEVTVRAEEVAVLADEHIIVVLGAYVLRSRSDWKADDSYGLPSRDA